MNHIALNYIYLSRKHAGGKDQVGLNLLKGFQENGVAKNMSIICYDYSVNTIRKISKDINIISLKSRRKESELIRMLKISLVNSFVIPRVIRKEKIDCVFHLSCNTGIKKQKVRSIVLPHDIKAISHRDLPGLHIPFYKYYLYKIMYEIDFKNADHIIGISDVDKQEIVQYYPKYADKVVRIYNPIDIPFPKDIKNAGTRRDIVAINLQFHHKNIITLIKAFEMIKDDIDHNLVLIGSVPKRVEYLREYVENHKLSDRIIFTGFISEHEKNAYLSTCRLYISPSLYEGFGMVSVEAMLSGVPTLLSRIPTNYEVTQGLCDYYEPAEDFEALAKAIKSIISRNIDDEKLSDNARVLWDTYNYRKIAGEYYDFLISNPKL